jgi:hypothetical protein
MKRLTYEVHVKMRCVDIDAYDDHVEIEDMVRECLKEDGFDEGIWKLENISVVIRRGS